MKKNKKNKSKNVKKKKKKKKKIVKDLGKLHGAIAPDPNLYWYKAKSLEIRRA